jgi:triphosphatase
LDDPRLRRDIGRLKARVTRRRRTLHAALVEAAGSTRTTRMLLSLGALFTGMATVDAAAPVPSARAVAASTLAQRDRQLRKRSKGLRELPPAGRHRARLAAKKLRYAAEFFAPLYRGARAARYIAALASLQAALGKLNDLAAAQRLLDELTPAVTPSSSVAHMTGIVRGWCIAAAATDLGRADKASRAFAKLKPFWH